MANAEYWQRGESLDYVNSGETAIPANTIIDLGAVIGVTGGVIAPGATGAIHVGGVWEMPKTGSSAIAVGTEVYFDGNGITDAANDGDQSDPTSYTLAGYAVRAAAADDTKILVKLYG